jgi:hypothetical protein
MQSKDQTKAYGQLDVDGLVSANRVNINYIANPPVLPGDLVVKDYVDNLFSNTSFSAGTGIFLSGTSYNIINVSPNQPTIVQVGTLNTGIWAASTISVSYGGTGRSSIPTGTLLAGNGVNSITSLSNLTYTNDHLYSDTPIIVNNTNNVSISTPTAGGFYLNGGGYIKKNLIVEDTMSGGSLVANYSTVQNSIFTTISMGNIYISGVSSIGNLTSTSVTTGGIISTSLTTGGIITTDLKSINTTTSNLNCTNGVISLCTTGDLIVTNASCSNVSISNLVVTRSTGIDAIFTNTTTNTLRFTSCIGVNLTTTNVNCTNITTSTLACINANQFTSRVTNGSFVGVTSGTFTNTFGTLGSILVSNGNYLNTTTGNSIVSFSTLGSMISVNHLGTNNTLTSLVLTSGTVTNCIITNETITNMILTNQTGVNLVVTNNTSTNLNCTSSTLGILDLTTGRCNSGTISTLFSTLSTIGTLKAVELSGTNQTYSNGVITNQSSSNLITTNLNITNQTGTNLVVSNQTGTNLVITEATLSNLNVTSVTSGSINVINGTISNINCTTSNFFRCNSTLGNFTENTIGTLNATRVSIGNLVLLETSILGFSETLGSLIHGETAGALVTLLPVNLTDGIEVGTIGSWSTCVFNQSTLTAVNTGVVTLKGSTIHVASGPVEGVNNTLKQSAAVSIGYVPNVLGGNLNGQILLGREDNEWYSGIYTEDTTNKTVVANGSIPGGGGIGLYSVNGPVTLASFPSVTNVTPVTFTEFSKNTSTFFSTVDANNSSTGSIVTNGGVFINKRLRSETQAIGYNLITISEGGSIILSATSGNIALSSGTSISNFSVTLPPSASIIDGMTIQIFSNVIISSVTFGNALVTSGSLDPVASKRFINVSSSNAWWCV